jgi:FkbM family methyltransferase
MSILKKIRTSLYILKTRGLTGIIQTIQAKLDHSFRPDEIAIVYEILKTENNKGFMIDVGAHHGQSLKPFIEDDWRVLAFEPDSKNRETLIENYGSFDNVIIDPRACAEQEITAAPLFTSNESTGVSGLSAFLNTHEATEKVRVTTLQAALKDLGLMYLPVDFLKIDTEGYDLMVLKGFPWEEATHPEVILTEFEDKKNKTFGLRFL